MPLLGESFHAYLRSIAAYRGVGMCTLQAVVMLCFIFDEESFSKMFLSVGVSCPKEPATGTQACSPCCTPTWSRRMRHWSARARARHGPLPCSSRNTRAALLCDPQTRDAKWARGSRSQTHRRAAKGGFTQTTVRWSEGLVPDRRPPPLFLRCSEKL